jgi:hypothetical protein
VRFRAKLIYADTANAIAAAIEFDRKKKNWHTLRHHGSSFIITSEKLSTRAAQ